MKIMSLSPKCLNSPAACLTVILTQSLSQTLTMRSNFGLTRQKSLVILCLNQKDIVYRLPK